MHTAMKYCFVATRSENVAMLGFDAGGIYRLVAVTCVGADPFLKFSAGNQTQGRR